VSNEHYRRTYYSETEAKAIVKRNEQRMTVDGLKISKARTGITDHQDAKTLGMTIEEYLTMVG